MRKEQIKLLSKAERYQYSEVEKEFLSREDISLNRLQCAFAYFYENNKYFAHEELVQEVIRCFQLKPENMTEENFIKKCRSYLLPAYSKDMFFKSDKKLEIIGAAESECSKEALIITFIKYDIVEADRKYLLSQCSQRQDYWTLDTFLNNECIRNDFCTNKEKSFLSYLCNTGSIRKWKDIFGSELKGIDNFYDREKSEFLFSDEFEKVIERGEEKDRIKWSYLREVKMQNNPLIKALLEKLDFNHTYEFFMNSNSNLPMIETVKRVVEQHNIKMSVTSVHYFKRIAINPDTKFLNITHIIYEKTFIYRDAGNQIITVGDNSGSKNIFKFFITPNFHFYETFIGKEKAYPLSCGNIMKRMIEDKSFASIMKIVFQELERIAPIFKDVLSDGEKGFLMPLSINEVLQYHNRKELIMDRFKTAQKLQIKWNRMNLNLSYLIIKSIPYVDEKGSQILMQQRELSGTIFEMLSKKRRIKVKDKVSSFLGDIICRRIMKHTNMKMEVQESLESDAYEYLYIWAKDYVNMCIQNRKKVILSIRTEQELRKKHDFINQYDDYEKETSAVKIPKETIFFPLYKYLSKISKYFEWIKNRKRLILETRIQHHCVWQYASKITEDKCAIYSYVDQEGGFSFEGIPTRYTIEFIYVKGKYKVRQVEGKYDKVNTSMVRDYVCKLLNDFA